MSASGKCRRGAQSHDQRNQRTGDRQPQAPRRALPISFRCFPIVGTPASIITWTGDTPVGLYNSSNLANIGLGHGAIDGGVGYTYFDQKTGHEFSAVLGFTGNFENQSTGYTSGIDSHLDWGASQFLTKQLQVGLVGYFYEQLSGDGGCAPVSCPFKSCVMGVGPQIGYVFPVAGMQGYVNLKGYGEFENDNRPDSWNVWLTFVLSPAPPSSRSSSPPMATKTALRN